MGQVTTVFKTRDDLPQILREMELGGTWVEVGVERGAYSKTLIQNGQFKKLILIDPWEVDKWFTPVDKETLQQYFMEVCQLQVDPRVTVLRSTSHEMSEIVEENLDFVFIDARHDFDNVWRDILDWWKKVKPGGVLGGHDFYIEGVKGAVSRLLALTHRPLHVACEEQAQSWYVIK